VRIHHALAPRADEQRRGGPRAERRGAEPASP
jgi:hypothetical protein